MCESSADHDGACHRPPDEVCLVDAEDVQNSDRIVSHRAERVLRMPRWRPRRTPGVTVVEPDDEPSAFGYRAAQLVVPSQHGGTGAVHEENGRIGRIAERLDAQLDPVDRPHLFAGSGHDRAFAGHVVVAPIRARLR
jgi:hypothetical protein